MERFKNLPGARARKIVYAVALVIIFLPLLAANRKDITLDQFYILRQSLKANPLDLVAYSQFVSSAYVFGLQNLLHSHAVQPDYKTPQSFFDYIWSRIPPKIYVFPTETYYYYAVTLPDNTVVAGNLRFLDADKGLVRFGYFLKNDPRNPESDNWYGQVGAEQGLTVKTLDKYRYEINYQGKTISVALFDQVATPPGKLALLPDEEFVTQIFDESGIRFFLLYNRTTSSFYYVLNQEIPVAERLLPVSGNEDYFYGLRTSYIYYTDPDTKRTLLVGVSAYSIQMNDYFDGPFDQVPPRLPLKAKLEAAYPYVTYRGGIDEHGNFNQIRGERVAISPYYDYKTVNDLLEYLSRCDSDVGKSVFWSCLTYEWKKDFHKTLEGGYFDHAIYLSQGWPANHEAVKSRLWPAGHKAFQSSSWKANSTP